MPPKSKITQDDVVAASLRIVRKEGMNALNARSLAQELNCSTHPIFRLYETMEDVKQDVVKAALAYYNTFFDEMLKRRDVPPYKASAWGYIQFAKEEKELFKILFMRERTPEQMSESDHSFSTAVDMIMQANGFDKDTARKVHLEMWVYAHGIATLLVTSYFDLSDEYISEMLSDVYASMRQYYKEKSKEGKLENGG